MGRMSAEDLIKTGQVEFETCNSSCGNDSR